jgi:hypothetical protein
MLFAQIRKGQQELRVVQQVGTTVGSKSPDPEGSVMIYEERIYTIMPGKMADIERRFADHTLKLFEKHEVKVVGFWKTAIGRQTFELVYILQYKDMNDRMEKWEAFSKDPEWIKARNDSETHGPLVAQVENKILSPLSFSPLK